MIEAPKGRPAVIRLTPRHGDGKSELAEIPTPIGRKHFYVGLHGVGVIGEIVQIGSARIDAVLLVIGQRPIRSSATSAPWVGHSVAETTPRSVK